MKWQKGISLFSSACLALTGMAGAFPALPEAAVVYAAESTAPAEAAVPAEVEKFCQDMLGTLELYQQETYDDSKAETNLFVYQYVSNQLKASLKQEKVSAADFAEAANKAGLSLHRLDGVHAAHPVVRTRLLPSRMHPLQPGLPHGCHQAHHQRGKDRHPCWSCRVGQGQLCGAHRRCQLWQLRSPLPRWCHPNGGI